MFLFIAPLCSFYGNKCYTSTVLAHSWSYSVGYNCFTQHMAAPQLILEWQELMCLCNNRQWKECLVTEDEKPISIHEYSLKVCDEANVDVSAAWWWVKRIKEAEIGGAPLHDKPWSGHPWLCSDATRPLSDELIRGNHCITTNDPPCQLVNTVIDVPGYSTFSAHWMPLAK